eukprot:8372464-Ditylum_brightwellii.AAC.1
MLVDEICLKLTCSCKDLEKAQKQAAELRDEYSEEMAMLQVTHSNTDLAMIIKNIRHREEVKYLFKVIFLIAKGEEGGTVLYSKVPKAPLCHSYFSATNYIYIKPRIPLVQEVPSKNI